MLLSILAGPRSETAICCSTSPRCACTTISRWLSLRRNEIRNAFLNRPTIGMPVLYVVAINATIWDTATTRSRTTSRIPQQRTGDHATNVHIVSTWRSGAQRWKTQSGSVRTRIVRRTAGDFRSRSRYQRVLLHARRRRKLIYLARNWFSRNKGLSQNLPLSRLFLPCIDSYEFRVWYVIAGIFVAGRIVDA